MARIVCGCTSRQASGFEAEDEEEEEDEEGPDIREEMREEPADLGIELDEEDASYGFSALTEELREEEENGPTVGSKEDTQAYALFETDHPSVTLNEGDSEVEHIPMDERMVRRYRHHWGIENGYKQIKTFRVRTTSKRHTYRFFNFVFACVLYNVWRLVDFGETRYRRGELDVRAACGRQPVPASGEEVLRPRPAGLTLNRSVSANP